jgi:Tfp pilus assembly protein PilF
MVDEADPVDIVKAAAVLAIALRKNQRKQKPKWLKREVKTTEHKALQSKQLLEEESRKQARAKITLNSYFTTSWIAENQKDALDLQIPKVSASGEVGSTGGESIERRCCSHSWFLQP